MKANIKRNNFSTIIYFAMILALNISCAKQNNSNKEEQKTATTKAIAKPSSIGTEFHTKLNFTNGIRAIYEDSKANFWFGSHQEGLCFYDGKTFQYFTIEDGLSNNQVRTIQEDQNGKIWLGTANGVSSYDGTSFTKHTSSNGRNKDKTTPEAKWLVNENDLWFNAGRQTGVYRFDGQQLNYLAFPIKENNDFKNPHFLTGFAKGKNNKVWISTYAGVFGHDGTSFTIINDKSLGFKKEIAQLHIRSIFEDSKGRLWIGNNGIGVLLHHGGKTINFSKENGLTSYHLLDANVASPNTTLEHVFAIAEDQEGNIWFGDRDTGAWKYDGKNINNYSTKDGLSNNFVQVIYQDKKGKLWFGMGDGTICQFNGKTFDRIF